MKAGARSRPRSDTDSWWEPGGPAPATSPSPSTAPLPPHLRLYSTFLGARVLLAVLLAAAVMGAPNRSLSASQPVAATALVYLVLTLLWWWMQPTERHRLHTVDGLNTREALGTIGTDLVCFSGLALLSGDFSTTAVALMAMPVLMASTLMPRAMALSTAAVASIILLSAGVIHGGNSPDWVGHIAPAGLASLGLFAVALIVSELALRLAREQRSARGHRERALQQSLLNQLVIEDLPEGLLAVDRKGRVRAANPAARRLLASHGMTPKPPFPLHSVPSWAPLVQAVERAFSASSRSSDNVDVALSFDDGSRRLLRIRLRFTRSLDARQPDDICVVFMEDLRTVQGRLRQDKLAAMGRMSAGIAHDIRNPLAAIAQANALMAEDAATPSQQRLTSMVADNVDRLKRIIDDILVVAPGTHQDSPLIDLGATIQGIAADWCRLCTGAAEAGLLGLDLTGLPPRELGEVAQVRFEPEHLRRVLENLLDNALRHGTGQAGCMRLVAEVLELQGHPPQVQVSVLSDGAAIDAETERALFEPFFSTRSRGTGLGLYICRELCARHGASMDFRAHPPTIRHRNEFLILMPLAEDASPPP